MNLRSLNPPRPDPATAEPIHIISLGAGVQSSTMALMAAAGEITPMPAAAVFADTQAEPASVYRWLDWLEKQLPFPVHRVTKGSLTETALRVRSHKDGSGRWAKSLIPVYTLESDGTAGHMQRACTYDFKLMELLKAQRRLAKIKNGQKTVGVIGWIGISLDEVYRMKPSREPWCEHRWPLVDLKMNRNDCLRWMEAHKFPRPPRSACVYCPFHSDHEWLRLKTEEPEEFQRAVEFEIDLQRAKGQTTNIRGVPYLHNSRKPLSQVDFSTEEERGQLNMFTNDCSGMCGV